MRCSSAEGGATSGAGAEESTRRRRQDTPAVAEIHAAYPSSPGSSEAISGERGHLASPGEAGPPRTQSGGRGSVRPPMSPFMSFKEVVLVVSLQWAMEQQDRVFTQNSPFVHEVC